MVKECEGNSGTCPADCSKYCIQPKTRAGEEDGESSRHVLKASTAAIASTTAAITAAAITAAAVSE